MATFELMSALQVEGRVRPVLLLNQQNAIGDEANRRGLEVIFSGEQPGRRRNLPWVELARLPWRLGWLRNRPGRTLVHVNDLGAQQSWGVAARMLGLPLVFHHHALNRMVPPNTTLIRLAERVLCVSQACRDSVGFLPPDRLEIVLNPISISSMLERKGARQHLLTELELSTDGPLLGFVGNFWKRKRPLFAIEVFARICGSKADARLIFFGRSGDYETSDLQAHAQALGVGGRVHFVGFRSPAEENVAALDLLLIPSMQEPFGRTLIEGALVGTPYVATDDAGHHEIGGRWGGGVLVEAEASVDAFAHIAMEALAHPERFKLSRAGLTTATRDFSPAECARRVLKVYERVSRLEGRRPAGS